MPDETKNDLPAVGKESSDTMLEAASDLLLDSDYSPSTQAGYSSGLLTSLSQY